VLHVNLRNGTEKRISVGHVLVSINSFSEFGCHHNI